MQRLTFIRAQRQSTIACTLKQPTQELERKIQKQQRHIDYLSSQLHSKKTHGGKRYRRRQISIKEQISDTTLYLNKLLDQLTKLNESRPKIFHRRSAFTIVG
ncbi:MAG: hypothetical protein P0S95_07570 [Rhabdochlamydiaceae bacterium]|nr:hypothetical protein [Candidatus Amphrikana amoebophyrae]